jgi:hypothetical protein
MTKIATPESDLDLGELEIPFALDKKAATKLGKQEIGYLVEQYYAVQGLRIQCAGRSRSVEESGEPSILLTSIAERMGKLEARLRSIFREWCVAQPVSNWALQVYGIGPVLAAGLEAHIRIERASSPSAVWRFAGLDPTAVWSKGQKRPYNARLKVLCWKIGESFKKVSGKPESLYGRLYRERKLREVGRNESGAFKEVAAATLASKKFGPSETRDAYEEGLLPAGRLDLRATRYATKVFLVHWWECAFRLANPGVPVPQPWVIAHGGHVDKIHPEVPFPTA